MAIAIPVVILRISVGGLYQKSTRERIANVIGLQAEQQGRVHETLRVAVGKEDRAGPAANQEGVYQTRLLA